MCAQGNEAWVTQLEHKFHSDFVKAKSVPWITLADGRVAGEVRAAGGNGFTAGNVTFVQVYEAGCVACDMLSRVRAEHV